MKLDELEVEDVVGQRLGWPGLLTIMAPIQSQQPGLLYDSGCGFMYISIKMNR